MIFDITFPSFTRDEFDARLEKLNRKLGKSDTFVEIVSEKMHTKDTETEHGIIPIVFTPMTVNIEGHAKIPGYEIKAVVDIRDDVREARTFDPNFNVEPYQTKVCDHCKTGRKRKQVYLLKNKFGEVLTVGTSCLEDFTGVNVSTRLRPIFKFIDDAKKSTVAVQTLNLTPATEIVSSILKVYELSNKFEKYATAIAVQTRMLRAEKLNESLHPETIPTTNRLFALHKDLNPNTSTYNHNLFHAIFYDKGIKRDFFSKKSIGIIAHAIAQMNKKEEAPKSVGEHLGEVSKKITVKGTIQSAKRVESRFGVSMLITVMDENENYVTTFSTSKDAFQLEFVKGDPIELTGTVKRHDIFGKRKQTVLTRCKFNIAKPV